MNDSQKNSHGKGSGQKSQQFNKAGGADQKGGDEPRMTKKQVIALLQERLRAPGTGNEYRTSENEPMVPTKNQKRIINEGRTKDIVMIDGTFGTGKTIWVTRVALEALANETHNGIILNAPAVDAGEDIGFRPGNTDEKMHGYVNQIFEAIEDWVGKDLCDHLHKVGLLKIVPNADMRGLSYKKKICIFDESQNASGKSLMTSLGRLGMGTTLFFMGDNNQNDRTDSESAYVGFMKRFAENPVYKDEIVKVTMTAEDVKRHPLLSKIVANGDHRPLEGHNTHRQTKKVVQEVPTAAAPANQSTAPVPVATPSLKPQ
ncbi:MAG: PhoH family protein [Micavibrio sp.]